MIFQAVLSVPLPVVTVYLYQSFLEEQKWAPIRMDYEDQPPGSINYISQTSELKTEFVPLPSAL